MTGSPRATGASAAIRGLRRSILCGLTAAVALGMFGSGVAAAKPRPPVLTFTPSPYHYGHVAAARGAASRTFTLADSGGQATGKLRVRLAGAAAFTITGDTCKTLAPGKKCTVTVRFAPAGAGTVTATLTAAGKKPAATATVALTGTGALGAPPGHLYWTTNSTISESNPNGSSPGNLVSGQNGVEALAVGATNLFWTNTSDGTIDEANLNGSDPHVIVRGVLSHGVAVDATNLYWTAVGEGAVYEGTLDGTTITDPHTIVTDQSDPWGVAVDADHLYWTNPRAGTVWWAGLGGSSPQGIVSGQNFPTGVTVGGPPGGLLYWADNGSTGKNGTIDQANLDGTSPGAIVGGQYGPVGVAADSNFVYWANPNGGTVNQADLGGNGPHALFSGQFAPYGVAVGP